MMNHDAGEGHAAHSHHAHCGPGYASPREAMAGDRERVMYTVALRDGTDHETPGYLATVDVDPASPTYSQVIHRTFMPYAGDELHHFGWNACSSCHTDGSKSRRYLVAPGFRSGRIHILDTADERAPRLHKVIEPAEVVASSGLSAPHTVHCLADGHVMISMLGDGEGNGPGGFLLLDENFDVAGRWEHQSNGRQFNYDFWYQPRQNVMVSTELGVAEDLPPRLQPRRRWQRPVRPAYLFLGLGGAQDRPERRPGRGRVDPARGALPARSGQHARVCWRRVEQQPHPLVQGGQ